MKQKSLFESKVKPAQSSLCHCGRKNCTDAQCINDTVKKAVADGAPHYYDVYALCEQGLAFCTVRTPSGQDRLVASITIDIEREDRKG
ncbi:MAG: hypothetical protein M9928_21805 [Anaerolineae bacterium]|nr:hypothetical protein [Anaerolineae bacterium]MCO5207652.1 hypothetical protein [Anaerolineae bacterium]